MSCEFGFRPIPCPLHKVDTSIVLVVDWLVSMYLDRLGLVITHISRFSQSSHSGPALPVFPTYWPRPWAYITTSCHLRRAVFPRAQWPTASLIHTVILVHICHHSRRLPCDPALFVSPMHPPRDLDPRRCPSCLIFSRSHDLSSQMLLVDLHHCSGPLVHRMPRAATPRWMSPVSRPPSFTFSRLVTCPRGLLAERREPLRGQSGGAVPRRPIGHLPRLCTGERGA